MTGAVSNLYSLRAYGPLSSFARVIAVKIAMRAE